MSETRTVTDRPVEDIERAHLADPTDRSFAIDRWGVPDDLTDLARRFWFPVWSVPAGRRAPQRVLQYPVCLLVITAEYARFYGVTTGISVTTLEGDGWAAGVMLQPAAGALIGASPVSRWTDRHVDLTDLLGEPGAELTRRMRTLMTGGAGTEHTHREGGALYSAMLREHLPVDAEGLLINHVVAYVEDTPDVTRVHQLCERFELTERTLQRLTRRRLGLTPKWMIQRRRLHEAAERLRGRDVPLASIAADLGYSDEAHFVRDFRTVTGMTPGTFSAQFDTP